jgi:hypothetical protein
VPILPYAARSAFDRTSGERDGLRARSGSFSARSAGFFGVSLIADSCCVAGSRAIQVDSP